MKTTRLSAIRMLVTMAGLTSLLVAGVWAGPGVAVAQEPPYPPKPPEDQQPLPEPQRADCYGDALNLKYPFDPNDGTWTQAMLPNDDESSAEIPLPFTFPFYGTDYVHCWINNNGNLSFTGPYYQYSVVGFPSAAYVMVAALWCDIDTRPPVDAGTGLVWYKFVDANNDGTNETLVATWDNVGYFPQHTDRLNTFQIAISDGTNPAMGFGNTVGFSYDHMCFTSSGSGFDRAATVGCNAGDNVHYFQLGLFDHAGNDYDGPGGNNDGVNWLDGQFLCLNTGTSANVPPMAQGFPTGNAVQLIPANGDTLDLTVQFLSPEIDQTTSVAIADPNGAQSAGLTIENTSGNMAVLHLAWAPTCAHEGAFPIEFTATDSFTPPGVTVVTLTITVNCGGGDCNNNGIPDSEDIANGTSHDCNNNAVPDECESDCNGNGVADRCDIDLGTSEDCNANRVPDECDIDPNDPDGNGLVSDDCNANGVPDECERAARWGRPGLRGGARRAVIWSQAPDQLAHSGVYMVSMDRSLGQFAADGFTLAESTTITSLEWWGTCRDLCGAPTDPTDNFRVTLYTNGPNGPASVAVATYNLGAAVQGVTTGQTIGFEGGFPEYKYTALLSPPLLAEAGVRYWIEVRNDVAFPDVWWWETAPPGAQGNEVSLRDAGADGYQDADLTAYDLAFGLTGLARAVDCNGNGVEDATDIANTTSLDCNANGIPDECEEDRNHNGVPDECDIIDGTSRDRNFNGVPDEVDCITRPGDLDGDCDVDADDLTAFLACMEPGAGNERNAGGCACADADVDGDVDMDDYLILASSAGVPDDSCQVALEGACPDCWATGGVGGLRVDDSFYDFGMNGHDPIPAGFFGPGSDPFTGHVVLMGRPADPSGAFGEVDTQVQHGPVVFDPGTGVAQTDLQLLTLDLISKDPITVGYNGGATSEQWFVVAGLSGSGSPTGQLVATLTKRDGNSGTFDATVYVQPVFLFVRVQDLVDELLPECVQMRILDTGVTVAGMRAAPPIMMQFDDQPFVREATAEISSQLQLSDCAQGNFIPGIAETKRGDGSRTQELTCESHITPGEEHYFCPPECDGPDVCKYTKVGGPLSFLCANPPVFPAATLGGDCGGGVCGGYTFKLKPCSGGGYAVQTYGAPACVPRSSTCKGACCTENGGCVMSSPALCDGTYMGDDTLCGPDACPSIGACCHSDHTCTVGTQAKCAALGGTYHGDNTDCTDTDGDRIPDDFESGDCCRPCTLCYTGTDPNNPPTDGDGISDGDEVYGTINGLDLPALGANPCHKDLFLECDWVTNDAGSPDRNKPHANQVARLVNAFANANVNNPDHETGIRLHFDYGQSPYLGGNYAGVDAIVDMTGNLEGDFLALKSANFDGVRRNGYFYYVISCDQLSVDGIPMVYSGMGECPGDDFIVAMGRAATGDDDQIGNAFMHELGHNLSLRHGGDEQRNYKPNYNSVMNYRFTFSGVDAADCDSAGNGVLNYSRGTRIPLDENALQEAQGVCGATAIDWNGDGDANDAGMARNINCEQGTTTNCGTGSPDCGDSTCDVLHDYNDWAAVSFSGLTEPDKVAREIVVCSPPRWVNGVWQSGRTLIFRNGTLVYEEGAP